MTFTIIVNDYIRDMHEAVEFDIAQQAGEFLMDYADYGVSLDLFIDGVYTPYAFREGTIVINPSDGEITAEDFEEMMDELEDFCDEADEFDYNPYAEDCDIYDFDPMDWDL